MFLSINKQDLENYLGHWYIPPIWDQEHDREQHFCFLDLLLSVGRDGQLWTSLYDDQDDSIFHITNFPFLSTCSNIPSSSA